MHQIDHVFSPHGLLWSMWRTHVHTGVHECESQKPTIMSFLRCRPPWVLKQNLSLDLKFGHQAWLGTQRHHHVSGFQPQDDKYPTPRRFFSVYSGDKSSSPACTASASSHTGPSPQAAVFLVMSTLDSVQHHYCGFFVV